MENNENEPDDVKKATPVENAISDGNKDEYKESTKGKKRKSAPEILNDVEESRKKRCNLYKGKLPSPAVTKNKKPCHPKAEIICRDNLTKYEYIDVLSTPKKSRGLSCKQQDFESTDPPVKRSSSSRKPSCKEKAALPRPISNRLEELAKPKPSHVMDLLKTWGSRLRPEIIDSVQKSLEENCAMSPEQMEAYYNEKDRENCSHVHRVRRKKCPGEKRKKKSTCDDNMDPETVCEEYAMAQRFVRHIISHLKNCPFAPEDHYDLTEVILSQLGNVLDYRPSGDGDRKFQMMFILANGIACWVHGMNVTVAEKLAKQQSQYAKEEIETEESEDEDKEEEEQHEEVIEATEEDEEEEDKDGGKEDRGEDEGGEENEEVKEVTKTHAEPVEEQYGSEGKDDNNDDIEMIEMNIESEEDDMVPKIESGVEYDNEAVPNIREEGEVADIDERTNAEEKGENEDVAQENEEEEESVEVADEIHETETEPELSEMEEELMEESEIEEVKEVEDETTEEIATEEEEEEEEETMEEIPSIKSMIEPGLAIQGLGEGDLFASDIPFVTFGKMMEIVVKFLDKFEEAETTEVRRRLENAILKKLTNLVVAEAPDALDDNMKAVLEVLAENIAAFMEDTLPKSKVNEVQTMTPEIESTEIRNWSHWLETVMDNATNWGKWIHEKVGEAEEKARTKVTRGDWQNWTSSFNNEALRWRIFNLDTKHRMHHADLNLTHKKVVHRGGMRTGNVMGSATLAPYPEKDEAEINAYDLSEDAKSLDQNSEIIDQRTS